MWYLVLSRSLPEQKENKELHLPEHRQWLEDQHRAGRVLFSGPTSDRSVGIYVVLAASLNDAEKLAAQDPDHVSGIGIMEVSRSALTAPRLPTSSACQRKSGRSDGFEG
jgi:uncharacterized protein YciI